MKNTLIILLSCSLFYSCNQQTDNSDILQSRIDSLEKKLERTHQSGFGEYMLNIQVHHGKLWFAGISANWKLANFQIEEIEEAIEDIRKFQSQRSETRQITMIFPALDSVKTAIKNETISEFKISFALLTNTCNNCHRSVNKEFNAIKIPDTPPYSNQEFKP